jgi:hypothetical protein
MVYSQGLAGQIPRPSQFMPNRLFYDLTSPQFGLAKPFIVESEVENVGLLDCSTSLRLVRSSGCKPRCTSRKDARQFDVENDFNH